MTAEPTLGEVVRHLNEIVTRVDRLSQSLEANYVRKDLYDARHIHLNRRVDDLEKDREADKAEVAEDKKARLAFQRQIVAGLIVGTLLMVAQLVITALMVSGKA